MANKLLNFTDDELGVIYRLVKEYEQNAPESDDDYHDGYYDEYTTPVESKVLNSILKKTGDNLTKHEKEEIDKDFLRKKYHTFNNSINERVYAVIEKAFSKLKSVEIEYFNMGSAEFSKRKIDVYYKSMRYTIGYCHLRKEIRKFRTSRIASAKMTKDSYKIPSDFNKKDY